MKRAATLFVCLLGLASCAKPPDVVHPSLDLDVPAEWNALTTKTSASNGELTWWSEFDASDDEALGGLIVRVLERNHDLRSASERVYAAAATATAVGANSFPQISASSGADRSRRNFIGLPVPGGGNVLTSRATSLNLTLRLDWELDVWGRLRAGQSASLADLGAARAEIYAARLSLMGQAVRLWLRLAESKLQLKLARATLESLRTTHDRIADRYARGLRPSLDVRLSDSSVSSAEANVEAREEEVARTTRQLEVLAGDYPSGSSNPETSLPETSPLLPNVVPAELVERRPDLAAAERRLAAAGARVDEARRALYPRFSLTTSGGTSSSELKDLVNGDFSVWTLAGNLTQPIFQGGRLLAGLDLAESREREILESYVQTALNAYREVESALAADEFLARRESALLAATEHSRRARDLADDRYARGLSDIVTVLEAQRRAFDAERQWLLARRLRLENRLDLHLALGGGYHSQHLDVSTPEENASKMNSPETGPNDES
ncbi:MAG: efflux transporter outer membrane subunit [Planctomycetota bacterium]